MRRLFSLGLCTLAACLVSVSAWAISSGCCCDLDFEVGAELLFMRPSGCDLQFTISDPAPFIDSSASDVIATAQVAPRGAIQSVDPEYSIGFRVVLGTQFDRGCSDIRFIYTWLHTDDSRVLTPDPYPGSLWVGEAIYANPLLFATEPGFRQTQLFNGVGPNELEAVARARIRYDYDAAEIQFATRKWSSCKLWTRTFIGLHVANLDGVFQKDYQGTQNPGESSEIFGFINSIINVRRSWKSWGIGPRFGGEGLYQLGCGIGFAARAGMSLLVGNQRSSYFNHYLALGGSVGDQVLQDWTFDLSSGRDVAVTPEFDARMGFSYLWCCGCFSISLEVGYEWITYLGFIPFGPEFRIDKGLTRMNCDPFSLDGFYVSVLGSF